MTFLNKVMRGAVAGLANPFGLKLNSIFQQAGSRAMANLLLAGGSQGFPGAWTGDRIEQSRHYKAWTYIAIKAIAEEVACNPPVVAAVRTRDEVKQKGLSTFYKRKSLATVQDHEELTPVDSNHPLCELLANPNEPDVAFDFWFETMMFLELNGNSYWWVLNNRMGLPSELWVLPATWVWPMSGNGKLIDHYEVRPYAAPGSYRALKIPAEKIIHFKYKSPLSKIDGMSPLQAAAEWIDTAESVDSTRWHSFKNGLWPGMVFSLDESIQDPDEELIDKIYARLDSRMRGEVRYDRPLIMPAGVKTDAISRSPREMDFTTSGDQLKDWIMAVHRVGKSIAGITEEVNYASMVAATANFVTRTIRPKLSYIGQVATEKLAKRFDPKLVIYWKDLAPEDPQQKTQELSTDYNCDMITYNEYRRERGRPPVPDGDLLPSERMAKKQAEQQQQQQAQQPTQPPLEGDPANDKHQLVDDFLGGDEQDGQEQDQENEGQDDLFSKGLKKPKKSKTKGLIGHMPSIRFKKPRRGV